MPEMQSPAEQPVLTAGQEVMDVNFNVGQRKDIAEIKQICADAYDKISQMVNEKLSGPATMTERQVGSIKRLEAIAKSSIENASIYAVKAVTR